MEDAIKDLTKVIEIEPTNAQAYNNRGYIYFSIGKSKEAIKDYRYISKIKP